MTSNKETNLPQAATDLIARIEKREAIIGVVGMGYVGLPLAVVFAEAGFRVIGLEVDSRKVEALQRGESYIEDVPSADIKRLVESGNLEFSTDYSRLADADSVSICVPTPLRKTGDPDLSYIVSAVESLKPWLHVGMAAILESTTYPGTTREMVLPEITDAGFQVGEDFFLAFSPERVDPGRVDWTTRNTPKVIGGISAACTAVACALYSHSVETVVPVSSTEVAEMAKLLENTFRAVNIGLVNELALMCKRLEIDVWEVIEAANTKPFGFMKFTPGPGLGGHCIPIDPLYLSWKLKSVQYTARFIELASEINTNMPRYVVTRVQDALNEHGKALKGSEILILGVAYKPDISDLRESPALDVIGLLIGKGARVRYFDPFVESFSHDGIELRSVEDPLAAAAQADCVVVVTNHASFDYPGLAGVSQLIFDSRDAFRAAGIRDAKIVRL